MTDVTNGTDFGYWPVGTILTNVFTVTNGGTFTSGTTDLSAAGVTATFYDTIGSLVQPRTS